MARVKYMTEYQAKRLGIDFGRFPNFSAHGSVEAMKKRYYGKDALLVRCGGYIYNVPANIYNMAH